VRPCFGKSRRFQGKLFFKVEYEGMDSKTA
jgi:hypothetical protein